MSVEYDNTMCHPLRAARIEQLKAHIAMCEQQWERLAWQRLADRYINFEIAWQDIAPHSIVNGGDA